MIALPVKLFANITVTEGASASPLEQAVADLVADAFFFLLRVGEYTCPSSAKKTRTRQFRLKDVTFWAGTAARQRHQLPFNTPLPFSTTIAWPTTCAPSKHSPVGSHRPVPPLAGALMP
jgi:hypothetical protein